MRHRHVRDQTFAEERTLALVGAVNELIDQHEGAGRHLLLERTAGRQRNQIGDAGAFQNVDIGAVVDVGRRQPMALVVARHEDDRQAVDLADAERARRLAPRRRNALLAHILQTRQVVDAGAADNAENRFRHASFVSLFVRGRSSLAHAALSPLKKQKGPETGPFAFQNLVRAA